MAAKLQANLLVIFAFILIAVFFVRVISPTTDTYFHLSIGRQIWQTHKIPVQDSFVYSSSNPDFISTEWLSGLIFFTMVKAFGLNGLTLLRLILSLTALFFLYQTLSLITKSQLPKIAALVTFAYIAAPRLFDRPENFSYLFLSFVNYIMFYIFLKRKIPVLALALPLIFLLWPNMHALAPLGLAIFSLFLAIFALEHFKFGKKIPNSSIFTLIYVLSAAACLLQFERFFYFLNYSGEFKISEFMSLPEKIMLSGGRDFFNQISLSVYIYVASVIIYLASFILFLKKKAGLALQIAALVFLVFFALPFKFSRLLAPVSLVSLPIFFILAKNLLISPRLKVFLAQTTLALIVLIITASIFTGHVVGSREDISVVTINNNQKAIANLFWKPFFPTSSAEIINKYLSSRRLFTSMFWSNYFLWFSPQTQVFADALWDYRKPQEVADEQTMASGENGWQELIKRYNIDTVVNSQFFTFYTNSTPVYLLPDWQLIYLDDVALIYARKDIIKSLPVDLSAIHPEIERGFKAKVEEEEKARDQLEKLMIFDPRNGFARQQLVIYWMDRDLPRAKTLAEQSKNLLPNDPIFSLQLAIIYARSGNCQQARDFAAEAHHKSFNHPVISSEIQRTTVNCLKN